MQRQYELDNPKLIEFKGVRDIDLKARQMGLTTYIAAKMFLDTITNPYTTTVMVAQDAPSTELIFHMVKRFYENLPIDQKPEAKYDSKTHLYWDKIDSHFIVGTAGSKKLGRGGTINNVHGSEVPQWEGAEEILSGLCESVPEDGNIFLEGTAKGVNNYFYNEYMAAVAEESIYTARFYPWYIDPTYRAKYLIGGNSFVITEEEIILQQLYDLDIEQLIWRRNKILALRNAAKDPDNILGDFPQEYPSNYLEAFLSSSSNVFDVVSLKQIETKISPPIKVFIPLKYPALSMEQKLIIYKMPVKGHRYIITADASEGVNQDNLHDNCSTDVIDADTWEQVAVLVGKWNPNMYATLCTELGWFYNFALMVAERNNHGHAVLTTMLNELNYPKENMKKNGWGGVYHYHEPGERPDPKKDQPGFPTNMKTKNLLIGTLQAIIVDCSLKINSQHTINELNNYGYLKGNKLGAKVGHDDRVISLALGGYILSTTTLPVLDQFGQEQTKKRRSNPINIVRLGKSYV
mgnify:CR=1 FL=1